MVTSLGKPFPFNRHTGGGARLGGGRPCVHERGQTVTSAW